MAYPEHKIQVAIVKYLYAVMPRCIVQANRNEHQKRGKAGMLAAKRNKAAGVFTGWPDLTVVCDACVFFLEVKAPRGRTSENQEICHAMLRDRGYAVGVVKSVDDVRDFLQANHIGFTEILENG